MKPLVSNKLRNQVARAVSLSYRVEWFDRNEFLDFAFRGFPEAQTAEQPSSEAASLPVSVHPEIMHFGSQLRELQRRSIPQFAALFKDDGSEDDKLPILVKVPDFDDIDRSYGELLQALSKSNIPLEKIDSGDAEGIFVERMSEFIAARSAATTTNSDTIVHTNRQHDTVLSAKGFFVSTGTGFGISSPAQAYLSPGRYSFGIMTSTGPKFEGVVWTCPRVLKANLP
jgi:hypothetical protein